MATAGRRRQLAMSILVRMADVYGATELMDISQAHIDSTIYLGDATLEFAERLASLGARVAVPTSLNVSGVDECGWKDWAVAPEWAAKAARQMLAYERMGAVPTWTCAPYQTHMRPVFGQQIAWGESNAIAFANSVIGARTERYPDLLDICCAITGRVPAIGLHLTENRARRDAPAPVRVPAGAAAGRSVLRRARPPGRQARRRSHSRSSTASSSRRPRISSRHSPRPPLRRVASRCFTWSASRRKRRRSTRRSRARDRSGQPIEVDHRLTVAISAPRAAS